jgi:hypothetical protein
VPTDVTSEWLAGAVQACNDAVDDPVHAEPLLRLAQVHALIAIAQEIAGIRELIILTEPDGEVDDGDSNG